MMNQTATKPAFAALSNGSALGTSSACRRCAAKLRSSASSDPGLGWAAIQRTIPSLRTVFGLDLDVTEACNLACTYCFKWQKKAVHMSEELAKSAIDWLLISSGDYREELKINFMGGEPLLRFDLIKKIVPYGKCRARQVGKKLHFGCTTNSTRLTDEMLDFWRRFGMGFHCSIDGIPSIQNANRPLLGGGPSSPDVEKNVRKILAYRPEVMARATVTPLSAPYVCESARYFEGLGFRNMTFRMALGCDWSPADFEVLRSQWERLGHYYIEARLSGRSVNVAEFSGGLQTLRKSTTNCGPCCGAGCGLLMLDPRGDMWPCHRFGPHLCGGQFLMGTMGGAFNDRLRAVFVGYNSLLDGTADCARCRASVVCRTWCYPECVESTQTLYHPGPHHCEAVRIFFEVLLRIDDHLRTRHPSLLESILKEPQ